METPASIATPKSVRTRQKMFDVTVQILSREGYAAWNEEYMCERCGCTRGALRYQFPDGKYDLFPAFIETMVAEDAGTIAALGNMTARERMYLFLLSLRNRPPSAATVAMLEISMAARGDAKLLARIEPILESANGRVLGLSENEGDPELLALRSILHGLSLYSFRKDFSPERLNQTINWLMTQLPVPPSLVKRTEEMTQARMRAPHGA